MKDQEIIKRRTELKALYEEISQEWKLYDERYPVLPGAYKPPDYESQQRRFLERLRAVSDEIGTLPRTTGEKLRLALIWVVIIAVILIGAALLVWRFLL